MDCGPTVNPDTIDAQTQSGIVYGLSAALYGDITIDAGGVRQANFNDYPVVRMNQMPKVGGRAGSLPAEFSKFFGARVSNSRLTRRPRYRQPSSSGGTKSFA